MLSLRFSSSMTLLLVFPGLAGCGGNEFVAGTADASVTLDASVALDAGKGFCASQPAGLALCSDFDELPLPENWNDLGTVGGQPVAEDDGSAVSPPNSLLATAAPLAIGSAATQAFISKTALPTGSVHIAFDMRVDELSFPTVALGASIVPAIYTQGRYEIVLAFVPSPTASPFDFVLLEIATDALADAGSTVMVHDLTSLFTQDSDGGQGLGSWQSIGLSLDIDHGSDAAIVSIGSASTTVTLTPPSAAKGAARTFSVGVQATPPTGATKIRFDNVTYSAAASATAN